MWNFKRKVVLLGSVAALALSLYGCQSAPKIRTQVAPTANLGQYKTYDYFEQLSTDKPAYSTILTRSIEGAVDREMQARGYVRGSNPDLRVNFNVQQRDKVRSSPGLSLDLGFGGWRHGSGYGWGGGVGNGDVGTVTEGTLTVDLVDREKKELVWSGSATGVLSKSNMDHPQKTVDTAVSAIFAKYPAVTAGSMAAR